MQFLRLPALQSIRIRAPEVKPLSWPQPSGEQQALPAPTYSSVCIPPFRSSGLVNASVIIGTALWSAASCHHCLITSFTTTMLRHWTKEVLLFSCQKWRGRTEKTERRAAMMIKGMKRIFCQEKQRCGASIWKRNNLGRIWPRSTKPYMACSLALPNQKVGHSKWIRILNKRQTWKQVKEGGSLPKGHVYWCLLNIQWIYWVVKMWKQAGFYYYIAVSCISLFLLFLPHTVIGKVKLSDHGQPFSLVKHTFIATKQKPENIINHVYIYIYIFIYIYFHPQNIQTWNLDHSSSITQYF